MSIQYYYLSLLSKFIISGRDVTGHSKFSFPILIQLTSAYDIVEAINSTQKSILKVSHKDTKKK